MLDPSDPKLLRPIIDELFTPKTVVRFNPTQVLWQKIDKDGIPVLGWRYDASTDPDVGALLHEMCHFVEIDEPRMTAQSWGLHYRFSSHRRRWRELRTMQVTAREIRVMAFQHHVHAHFGLPTWRDEIPTILSINPDWYHVPGISDGAREKWLLAHYDRLVQSKRYRYSIFLSEWRRRNSILADKLIKIGTSRSIIGPPKSVSL